MPHYSRSPLRAAQEAARERGDHIFTTTQPCANGHLAARYSSNGVCVRCAAEYRRNVRPPEQRQLKISNSGCQVRQVSQDARTVRLSKTTFARLNDIMGRPVSLSVIHKAGLVLLDHYLSEGRTAVDVLGLVE